MCLDFSQPITSGSFRVLLIFRFPFKSHRFVKSSLIPPCKLLPIAFSYISITLPINSVSCICRYPPHPTWMLETWEKGLYVLIFKSSSQFLNYNNDFKMNKCFRIEGKDLWPQFYFLFYSTRGGKWMLYTFSWCSTKDWEKAEAHLSDHSMNLHS